MATQFKLIEDASLRANPKGFAFVARLDWYRSLPLSCVVDVKVKLDGREMERDSISLGINGHEYKLDDLQNQYEEFWFIQDGAMIAVNQPGLVAAGESHDIWVETTVFAPYIPVGPGKFLTMTSQLSSTQIAE